MTARRSCRTATIALLAAAAWAAACGAPGAGGAAGAGAAPGALSGAGRGEPDPSAAWSRDIAPFAVADSAGAPYALPFLGGFDVPRPQLIDIDADGDPDLFIQERSNELMFLENVGTTPAPDFVWRTDRFEGLDIHEWYRFVDMDQDGDYDLLAEQPFSYIRYYRNDGTPSAPRFTLAADTLRRADGQPLYSDRQNIPNAVDLDCNRRTDLFAGRVEGTVTRYEASEPDADVPRFRMVTERFADIEIVNTLMASLHGANTMDFADADGDGDLDLFWGDFFEPGLLLLENIGTRCDPAIRNDPIAFPPSDPVTSTGYNAPAVADLTGDGRPDMLMGVLGGAYNPTRSSVENLYYLEQTDAGWTLRSRAYLDQIDLGSETVPALLDDDGDGDLDLLVGSKIDPNRTDTGLLHRFENVGAPGGPRFAYDGPLPVTGAYHYAPEGADLDSNGRPDLLIGTWNGGVLLLRNTGGTAADRWALQTEPLLELTRGSNTTPAAGDLDGDGDLDLVVGEASGTLNYYRNDGDAASPDLTLVSDEWLGIDVGRRSHPELVDLDADGDLDMVVGNEDGRLTVFRNGGTPDAPDLAEDPAGALPGFPFAAPALVDLDGDGRHELIVGGLSGGLVYYRQRP